MHDWDVGSVFTLVLGFIVKIALVVAFALAVRE